MLQLFVISAEKIISLLIFFVLGFLLAHKKLVPENAPLTLSKLLTLLFCPALTLNSLATNFNRTSLRAESRLVIVGAVSIAILIVVSRFLSRAIAKDDENLLGILRYNLLYGNFGYIGYPIIQGLFGDYMLAKFMLFAVPANIICYTYGRMVVEGKKKISFDTLLSPLSMAIWLGLLIGLLEIPLPNMVKEILTSSGNCMGPISMLISGMILSKTNFRQCFCLPQNYLLVALRLFILPLLCIGAMLLLNLRDESLLFLGCMTCLPFGNNAIVYRAAEGMDTQKAAGMTLLSYAVSLVSVPFMITLMKHLASF